MNDIFVSIVAYCDNELKPTLDDLFAQAKHPENIYVGIINQDDEPFVYDNKNVEVLNIKPEESPGYGKCRLMCNTKLRKKTRFYFQCDPHSRFTKNWDEKFINYYNSKTGKHIIVCTPSAYEIDDSRYFKYYVIGIDGYHEHCVVEGKKEFEQYNLPFDKDGLYKTNMFLAGCIFAESKWADEVPYDDNIFMWGEEFDLSIRTYGAGYKAYLTKEEMLYHLWGHKNRKHIGYVRQQDEFNRLNNAGKKYIYEKLLAKQYKRQSEFFNEENLDFSKLNMFYKKWLYGIGELSEYTVKCRVNYNRRYSTNCNVQQGGIYDIPIGIYLRYPWHFEEV